MEPEPEEMDSWVEKFPWRKDRLPIPVFLGFPGGLDSKESACSVGDLGSIPGLGSSPRGGHGNPLQYSCLENPLGERRLVGYSSGGCKESNTIEQLSTAQPFMISIFTRDGGAWWAAVYGVTQSRTRLKRLSSSSRWT